MRWRPTLAALGVLSVAAVLLVAMSSASSPTVASPARPDPTAAESPPTAQSDEQADAQMILPAPEPGPSAPLPEPPAAPPLAPAPTPEPPTPAAEPPAAPVETVDPAAERVAAVTAGDPLDLLGPFLANIAAEQHQDVTEEERERLESIPDAGGGGESLGRPARRIKRGPAGEVGEPRLYLTFDDGPHPVWTRRTLDVLDRHGARATFFPVGAYAAINFNLIEEIIERGHTLGSHLWTHEQRALYDEDLFRHELRASAAVFGDHATNCLRPPYGIVTENVLRWAGEEGFEVLLWGDVDPEDWKAPGTAVLTERILNGVRPGTILLLHERTGSNTLAALDAVLAALADRGWQFDEPICPLQF